MPDRTYYSFLDEADRENPISALNEIFERYDLPSVLRHMLDFYRAALESDAWSGDDPLEKSNRCWFFETTLYLYEIAHRIKAIADNGELVLM